jgi:hypothetical protein
LGIVVKRDRTPIIEHFQLPAALSDITPVHTGHINDTYLLTTESDGATARFILQRINHDVFKNPPGTMANITRVTEHIRAKMEQTDPSAAARQLTLVAADDGTSYHRDEHGNYWRIYHFVEDAVTYDMLESPELACESARMFGWFQKMLVDLPGPRLHDSIPDFHNTPLRVKVFHETLKADACNRAKDAKPEIDFVLENVAISEVLPPLVASGAIPMRIAHNDAKINNVMLDRRTGRGVCVIDLDTVMPGLSLYDFGDLIRTAACSAAEDERDLSKVTLDIALFAALARGFAAEASEFLTPAERAHLVFAGKLITYEQLIRFLTDYLAGDTYYKVQRQGHNLDRSRTQMKLVQSIMAQEEEMNAIVQSVFRELDQETM